MRVKNLEEKISPSVIDNGCDLWGIDFLKGKNTPIIRVYIDAIGGATLADCEKVSKELNYELPLDSDLVDFEYILEVSTPGMDRKIFKFEQFKNFVGESFNIKLKMKINEGYSHKLKLVDIISKKLLFEDIDGTHHEILFSSIDACRLIPRF